MSIMKHSQVRTKAFMYPQHKDEAATGHLQPIQDPYLKPREIDSDF